MRERRTISLNFIPFDKQYQENAVELGYPGESTKKAEVELVTPSF